VAASAGPSPELAGGLVDRLRQAGCVFAEDEARLLLDAAGSPGELGAMVARRCAGDPLEQVLGWAEFRGLRIAVEPGVFVPRQRTECLVEQALPLARQAASAGGRPVVVDLCCGSGAVAVALAAALDAIELYAADVDQAAVRCAERNLAGVGQVVAGDLFEPLPRALLGRVDVLVANAPYVPTEAIALMPPEARLHEPPVALDGGPDGLDVLHRVVAGARPWLAPGGTVLVECSEGQAAALIDAVVRAGLHPRTAGCEAGGTTVVLGRREG
jgi:release factor glutamine methyltransferase